MNPTLLKAVEAAMHVEHRDEVHRRYPDGDCPHCPPLTRLRSHFAAQLQTRLHESTSEDLL